MNHPDMAYHKL